MDFKLLGSALLVVGTAIGAGMLALPIVTAELGFIGSLILLFFGWFVMTTGALYLLEANLWLPANSNIISMAKNTLGPIGALIAWIAYLILLYSLICAYIAGGSDLLRNLLSMNSIDVHPQLAPLLFTLLFGGIVYLGLRSVDYANRVLMFIKFSAFFILLGLLFPLVSVEKLNMLNTTQFGLATAVTVTMTSFGFGSIVPSLRLYFKGDTKKLRSAVIIGSLIPLICYIAWDCVIMGIIPIYGANGLVEMLHSERTASDLVNTLSAETARSSVTLVAKLFTTICVLTSFLGVSLGLSDFLADGLQVAKKGWGNAAIQLATFLPPVLIVLFFPAIFIQALKYAGIYCLILLVLMPACMVWRGRYVKHFSRNFSVPGGRPLLLLTMLIAISVIAQGLVG